MKILVLSHVSQLVGGAERSILEVMDILAKKHKVQPEFILREPLGSYVNELQKRNWKFYSLPFTFWSDSRPPTDPFRVYAATLTNGRAIFEIEEIIKKSKPDLVLTNSVVCPWAAIASHFQRVPHMWFVREYGDLDHGRIFEIGRQKTFEDVDNLSELVITNSLSLNEHVKKYVNNGKVTTLYHPFDIAKMRKQSEEYIKSPFKSPDSLKLMIVGSITASKGHSEVVTAVGELNKQGLNTELCVIGSTHEADFMAELRKTNRRYDSEDKIHFVGSQANPLAYIAHADVGIMASRREAFGRVTFEYLTLGKAIVGADTGATPEMVEDGKNGYLYKQGDVKSLVAGLMRYAKNRELIELHGIAAQQKAEAMIAGEHNIEALFERIQRVAQNGVTIAPPINYSHRWLEYSRDAKTYIDASHHVSLKRLLYLRLRERAKPLYIPLRGAIARLLGR